MDTDDQVKPGGTVDKPLITDIVKIHILIVRMQLDPLKPQILYLLQDLFVVAAIRVDPPERNDRTFLKLRGEPVNRIYLRYLRNSRKSYGQIDTGSSGGFAKSGVCTVRVRTDLADPFQKIKRPLSDLIREHMCMKINNHGYSPPFILL